MSGWNWKRRNGRGFGRPTVAACAVTAVSIVGVLVAVGVAGASSSGVHLAQVQRAAPAPGGGTALGAAVSTAGQSGEVVLKPRDESALQQFIAGLDDRRSSDFHDYLRPGQFAARFGPTKATVDAVTAQLKADGLTVSGVSSSRLVIRFAGTTSTVNSAFHTNLERFRTQTGTVGQEATRAVELPSSIAGDVSAVIGLNTLVHPEADLVRASSADRSGHAAAKRADITTYPSGSPDPCSDATNAAESFGGLTDDQIANAYGAFGEYSANDTGSGVRIGVYEGEPFSTSDVQTFDQCYFGDTAATAMLSRLKTIPVDGGLPAGPGSGEAILDVEDVSGIAPGANIDVYEAPNTEAGAIDEYAAMIDADADTIITSSWGLCEQDIATYEPGEQQAENDIFEQAAAQGQTVLNAAGDTGDDTCNEIRSAVVPTDQNPLSVGDPASQPYVLGVGGTTITDADPSDYAESVWNDGATWGGGGGGISMSWAAPGWQLAAPDFPLPGGTAYTDADTFEADSVNLGFSESGSPWTSAPYFCANNTAAGYTSSTPCRGVPDVSAQADEFTGAITVYSSAEFNGWGTIGGTSSATPIWAALLALVDASRGCSPSGGGTSGGIGFVSPLLYAIAANPTEYANAFHDITTGNNDDFGFDDGKVFPATAGYDLASGLGSPILTHTSQTPGLAEYLCYLAGTTTPHPAITSLSSSSGSTAGGQKVTVTGTGFAPGGATVSHVTVGSDTLSASEYTVNSNTSITVTMPAAAATLATTGATGTQDGAGPAQIVVTLSSGVSSTLGSSSQYNYVDETGSSAVPSVTSVFPYAGLENGPRTVTIYGSGFTATGDTVSFGGVNATSYTFVNAHEITVTPPSFSSAHTDCSTAAAITAETANLGENNGSGDTDPAADDICQTSIQVTSSSGSSAETTPLPVYEGAAPTADQDGLYTAPAGFELSPQPTEFDYVPAPTITSVSTTSPADYADAYGGTTVTITGTGLNDMTLNWLSIGDPTLDSSTDTSVAYFTGTTLVVAAPKSPDVVAGTTPGPQPDAVPVSADTMAGQSPAGPKVTYAGLPVITSVSTGKTDAGIDVNPGIGYDGASVAVAPSTGGTPLTITGSGFEDAVGSLQFVDASYNTASSTDFSQALQYRYTATSDTSITTQTLPQNPALAATEVCTASGCSAPSQSGEILLYPTGAPAITGVDVTSGPSDGGTTLTLTGENLGCVTGVSFGGEPAQSFDDFKDASGNAALLDCGFGNEVTVVTPPGTSGTSVPITLTTVESDATGAAAATSPTEFTYGANPTASLGSAFGSVDLGSSATETVTVTNASTQPLAIGTANVEGTDPGDYSIASDACSTNTIAAADTCAITVTFAPIAVGSRPAELDIPWNSSATDLTVALTGTGASPTSTVTKTTTVPGPTTTVTVPGKTTTTTVTTPGPTTTVTVPGPTTTTTRVCVISSRTKTVTKRIKVHGRTKIVHEKVHYKVEHCTTSHSASRSHHATRRTRHAHRAHSHRGH